MPDRDWPPMQRHLARGVRAAMYLTAATAGGAVIAWPPAVLTAQLGAWWVHALGALALAAGALAFVGALAWRWHLEWVAGCQLAGAYTVYTALQWIVVARQGGGHLATALLLTALTAAILARAVDLWVFSLTATRGRAAESDR